MRITPTPEQIKYLTSIGVEKSTITQPNPAGSKIPAGPERAPVKNDGKTSGSWLVFMIIVLGLYVLFAHLAHGADASANPEEGVPSAAAAAPTAPPAPAAPTAPVSPATFSTPAANTPPAATNPEHDAAIDARFTSIGQEIEALKHDIGSKSTKEEMKNLQNQIRALDQRLISIQKAGKNYTDMEMNRLSEEIKRLRGRTQELTGAAKQSEGQMRIVEDLADQVLAIKDNLEKESTQSEADRGGRRQLMTEVQMLRKGLDQQRSDLRKTIRQFSVIVLFILGLLVTGGIFMERRIRRNEKEKGDGLRAEVTKRSQVAENAVDEQKAEVKAIPSPKENLPATKEQILDIQDLIGFMEEFHQLRVHPVQATGAWVLGLATSKGNIRNENQDCGICFQMDGHVVLILADGCGGHPHGREAAYLAVEGAAESVIRNFGTSPSWYVPGVKDAAAGAIMGAAHRLACEGERLNITRILDGLRTTLIVIIGNKQEIGYAYIGDGGGYVVRSSGEEIRFLLPQKADGPALNLLKASLGPKMQGEPILGVINRAPGDLLIVGTDGIFDRVKGIFPKAALRSCIHYAGDLQETAEVIVEALASSQDEVGYIFEDNLILGLMGDGVPPRLPPGFWSPADTSLGTDLLEAAENSNNSKAREGV